MATASDEPDVALILEQLRTEVRVLRTNSGEDGEGTALSAIERELHRCSEQLEITRVVSAHWPLEGGTLYERAWILVHKVVRRGLRWYIPPIVEQQNAFNDVATRTIRLLIEAHAELRDQVAEFKRRLDQEPSAPTSVPPASALTEPTAAADLPTETLQQQVERAGRAEPPAALPELELRPLPALVNERATVSAHWDLAGNTPLTVARALSQRSLRQYLRWMVNPIVEQQNAANAALATSLPQLLALDGELRARVAALRARRPLR